ncbi:MAG: hypothetical protein ACJASB_000833 [Shewanella psychromarinicola]|jgi:hypothetical protein|uniref:hypothetical protein n=1 Tax=Shewanella psychromarinicola TaxID=2487742 RepID=UPI003EEFD946
MNKILFYLSLNINADLINNGIMVQADKKVVNVAEHLAISRDNKHLSNSLLAWNFQAINKP